MSKPAYVPKYPMGAWIQVRFDGSVEGEPATVLKSLFVGGHSIAWDGEKMLIHYSLRTAEMDGSSTKAYTIPEWQLLDRVSKDTSPVPPFSYRCETCQQPAEISIPIIGCHFCNSCIKKIDARMKELNANQI